MEDQTKMNEVEIIIKLNEQEAVRLVMYRADDTATTTVSHLDLEPYELKNVSNALACLQAIVKKG